MAFHSLENMMGKTGCVKIANGVYLYGEIKEHGRSGASGHYAVLEGFSNGRQIKVGIFGESALLKYDPRVGNPQAKIVGRDNS